MPWGVNDIDAVIVPGCRDRSRCNRDSALALLSHPVGDCGAVMHLAHLVNHTGIEKDAFRTGGFAGVNMGGNPDISDAFQGKGASHRKLSGVWR
ncbi:MAG: Uncharacterised protein [Prochlorococcus marinus str. MIT 9313]|nr:MAG: Uncharacterised protein [Prochlorococcus marinus str. MIT 9313]